jgi:hypothetical protein
VLKVEAGNAATQGAITLETHVSIPTIRWKIRVKRRDKGKGKTETGVLLVPQRANRIDGGGFARRQIARQRGDRTKKDADCRKGDGVGRVQAEEE